MRGAYFGLLMFALLRYRSGASGLDAGIVAVAIGSLGGCDRGEVDQRRVPSPIRVSAPFGLAPLEPGPLVGGSSAAILDLIFDPINRHMRTKEVVGASVVFERLPNAPPIQELVSTFRVEELVSMEQVGGDSLRVTMSTEAQASALAAYQFGGFERGDFTPDPWSPRDPVQRLRAADGRVIELVAMPVQEQWRRLLARDIDVVPYNSPGQRSFYDGLTSVRLLDVPSRNSMTLLFNMETVPHVAERRHISRAIDRRAVALVCGGSTDLRSRELEVEPGSSLDGLEPRTLRISFLDSDQQAVDAVRVVRMQLEKAGYTVELEPSSIEELIATQADLSISPMIEGLELARRLRQMGSMLNYDNPALNQAIDGGDLDRAAEILRQDTPAIPLYHIQTFAAVDARLCGGNPESSAAWDWIADLHPCEDGR